MEACPKASTTSRPDALGFLCEFRAKYVTDMYKEVKLKQFLDLK